MLSPTCEGYCAEASFPNYLTKTSSEIIFIVLYLKAVTEGFFFFFFVSINKQKRVQGHPEYIFYFDIGGRRDYLATRLLNRQFTCTLSLSSHYDYILQRMHIFLQNCLHTTKLQNHFQSCCWKGIPCSLYLANPSCQSVACTSCLLFI